MGEPTVSQLEIIQFPYLPETTLKVVAGPGSGKTFTLLCKIHELINSGQVRPDEILVLSLTNKAVDNIIGNLLKVFHQLNEGRYSDEEVDEIVSQVGIYTLHGLSNRIVTENIGIVNIIEENGWRGLLKLIPEEFWTNRHINSGNDRFIKKHLEKLIADYHTGNIDEDKTIEKLANLMKVSKVFTNADLIKMGAKFLSSPNIDEEISFTKSILQNTKIVIVDEFQDLYPEILPLLETISLKKQLIMFGDINQSIYGFLGSNTEVLKRLENLRPPDKIYTKELFDNFRNTPEIIEAANHIVSRSSYKNKVNVNVVSKAPSQVLPSVTHFEDLIDEMNFLLEEITQLVCSSAKFSDIGILTTTNAHSKVIAEHLANYGIPVTKLTAQPDWMTDQRIRYIIDVMQVASSVLAEANLPRDSPINSKWRSNFSVIITLAGLKGLGSTVLRQLHEKAMETNMSLWNYLNYFPSSQWPLTPANTRKVSSYISSISRLIENGLASSISEPDKLLGLCTSFLTELDVPIFFCKTDKEVKEFKFNLEEFYSSLKLSAISKPEDRTLISWFLETFYDQSIIFHNHRKSMAANDNEFGSVNISTIHASKGLEFPIVFLMGRQQYGNFNMDSSLLYVAMTRARNKLFLTNVNHPRVKAIPNSNTSLLDNELFWKYYNNDMNRSVPCSNLSNHYKYKTLQKRFGIGNKYFHTVSKFVKKFPK